MSSSIDQVDSLRKRNVPLQTKSDTDARETVLQLNALEETNKSDEPRKTFGRTPNGTVFTVPVTHDMVSQLLSPKEPKNVSDVIVLIVLALHIITCWALPASIRVPVLGLIFLLWRAGYNIGIGWLLHKQSRQITLVRWAKKSKLFEQPQHSTRPKFRAFLKRELETKIPKDYNYDTAPLEYNTWLVFRRIVDLILMCDFTSYVLFAIACSRKPPGESLSMTGLRWSAGIILFLFNLWVKLDAHRVVKDYAWYWGDFFYLIDQDLTFDGVFEMAPHPMYSIGYVGYYGISMMAASYKVLFVSIVAHLAQFAFLYWVENPHIERTYNSPPPRQQINGPPKATGDEPQITRQSTADAWPNPSSDKPSATHNLLGLHNLDLYRTTDSSLLIILFCFLLLTLSSATTTTSQTLFMINAVFWRLWFSVGIGYLLNRQSVKKKWTRHFLKFGESTGEAWRQWKGTYHMSMMMCYASFAAAAWKTYQVPADWEYGLVLLRHVVGSFCVALQIWVSISIYDSLGEFGWFFGDFFFNKSATLTYSGIYRFLNNPERFLGLAGVWGIAMITNSKAILGLAMLSHILSMAFIQLVERPHMQKIYGQNLRQDSGLVRSLNKSLPTPFSKWRGGMGKAIDSTFDVMEEFLETAKPKLASGVNTFFQDTKYLLQHYPARITITRIEPEVVGFDINDYSIEIENPSAIPLATNTETSPADGTTAPSNSATPLLIEYGAPIKIKWTAPLNHSNLDWIGLYNISDNKSREVTRVSSAGRWIATNTGEYDTASAEEGLETTDVQIKVTTATGEDKEYATGEMVFSKTKLWWTQGSFEFRYHHNGKHNVMAISTPFEIRIPRFNEEDLDLTELSAGRMGGLDEVFIRRSIEQTLLPVVRNCFDRDPNVAPTTSQETFGTSVERDGRFARRVVYAIHQMFGIEFAPEVVKADGKVEHLAWRIWEAKKVLAPYSMSRSRGTTTPEERVKDL